MRDNTVNALFGDFDYEIITECEGPNCSDMTFIYVNGHVAIVQEFIDSNGFQIYVAAQSNSVQAARELVGIP